MFENKRAELLVALNRCSTLRMLDLRLDMFGKGLHARLVTWRTVSST